MEYKKKLKFTSIRFQLIELLLMFVISFCIIISFSYYGIFSIKKDFSGAVNSNEAIQQLRINHSNSQEHLVNVIRSPNEQSISDCRKNSSENLRFISNLQLPLSDKESELLQRAIAISYEQYAIRLEALLESIEKADYNANDYDIILIYRELLSRGSYIETYINELQSNSIRLEGLSYIRAEKQIRFITQMLLALATAVLLVNVLTTINVMKHILHPLASLHRASADMRSGIYADEELTIYHQDEIGDLTETFNQMRKKIQSTMDALVEKNKIEKELYEKELQAAQTEKLLEEAKYKYLQSQINPHFLYNSLNTISILALEEKANITYELLMRLSEIFHYYTSDITDETITLKQELDLINNYMELQSIRFYHRISWELYSDPEAEDYLIPKFLLQPIVENSVVHGLAPKGEGKVVLRVSKESPSSIHIVISDDGCGFSTEDNDNRKSKTNSSIGIKNVKERLLYYSPKSTFSISSKVGYGTTVDITIVVPEDRFEEDKNE